ncbi:unnamed protein product [Effrenium voratum]|uniref:Methyltransferase FkbM domain-containing protein n=3 Tax=Effrenium voratum TaxID=2562239 RepID=A0AA36IKV9_9DINO|nr:unnamed protein product [Effrenium voratum]
MRRLGVLAGLGTGAAQAVFGSPGPEQEFGIDWLEGWHSQYGQDRKIMRWFYSEEPGSRWYMAAAGQTLRQGVFVDLGAGDGVEKSNSLAFEEKLGWTGLLIEPMPAAFRELQKNRPKAKTVRACVAGATGDKDFVEDGLNSGTTSRQQLTAASAAVTRLRCRSLGDLIDEHLGEMGAHIDYLSLDTEGSELEILRSFNFQKHRVDVISVEVDDILPEVMYKRLSDRLRRNNYAYLERLGADEIWVRQLGFHPDPTCLFSLPLQLDTVPASVPDVGWGGLRRVLKKFLVSLGSGLGELGSAGAFLDQWATGDLRDWSAQCPAGMLSLGLAFSLTRTRDNAAPRDRQSLANELRHHTVFHWNDQLQAVMRTLRHSDLVKASELAGEDFHFRAPLGRLWHLTSFEQILEADWPFFGLLSLASKQAALTPQVVEHLHIKGIEEIRPLPMPRIRCILRVGNHISLEQKLPVNFRSKRKSTPQLLLSTDACSLLGTAASNFHHARREVRRLLATEPKERQRYDRLVNWTCEGAASRRSLSPGQCQDLSLSQCLGLDGTLAVPACRLQPRALGGLRLRRKMRLDATRVSSWVDQGERLFRVFVERHGLFLALWAAAQPELAPVRGATAGAEAEEAEWPDPEEVKLRETMFDVLHSLQQEISWDI